MKRQAGPTPDSTPRKRRRLSRGCHGIEANDMSLITDENYFSHPVCHGIALTGKGMTGCQERGGIQL
jgi:hypothetical protein